VRYFERRQRKTREPSDGYSRSVDQLYDERKFRELLVLVAGRLSDDEAGGATKLNKVLYFADFAHVRRTGRSIRAPSTRSWRTVRHRAGCSPFATS
jgi:hypothetical protein